MYHFKFSTFSLDFTFQASNSAEPSQQEYDDFFKMVDKFLWDSADEQGRMYRRGEIAWPEQTCDHLLPNV